MGSLELGVLPLAVGLHRLVNIESMATKDTEKSVYSSTGQLCLHIEAVQKSKNTKNKIKTSDDEFMNLHNV